MASADKSKSPVKVDMVNGGPVSGAEKLTAYAFTLLQEFTAANLEKLWSMPKFLAKLMGANFNQVNFLYMIAMERQRVNTLQRFLHDHASRQKVLADIFAENLSILTYRFADNTPLLLALTRRSEGALLLDGLIKRNRKVLDAFTSDVFNYVSPHLKDSVLYTLVTARSGKEVLRAILQRNPDLDVEFATLEQVFPTNLETYAAEDRDPIFRLTRSDCRSGLHENCGDLEMLVAMAQRTAERRGDARQLSIGAVLRRARSRPGYYWGDGTMDVETSLFGLSFSERGCQCLMKILGPVIAAAPSEEELAAQDVDPAAAAETHIDPNVSPTDPPVPDVTIPGGDAPIQQVRTRNDRAQVEYIETDYAAFMPPNRVHPNDTIDLATFTDLITRHKAFKTTITLHYSCAMIELMRHESGVAFLEFVAQHRPSAVALWGRQIAYKFVADPIDPTHLERERERQRTREVDKLEKAAKDGTLDAKGKKELKKAKKKEEIAKQGVPVREVKRGSVQNAWELSRRDWEENLDVCDIGRRVLEVVRAEIAQLEAAGFVTRTEAATKKEEAAA